MKNIKIMDCTLRDGGWINDFRFGSENIDLILSTVEKAGIEYIELGYMDKKSIPEAGRTFFSSYEELRLLGEKYNNQCNRVVMIDYGKFSVENLPDYDQNNNFIDGIRVCFHKKDLEDAIIMGKRIVAKGYNLFVQPMVTTRYSDDEFKELLDKVKTNIPEFSGVYVVDSFGSMTWDDIYDRLMLCHRELEQGKILGLHLHNNLNHAFENAQKACSVFKDIQERELIIDGTLMGMGKGAGNVQTEDLADLMNKECNGEYDTEAIKSIVGKVIAPIRESFVWGCTPEYELSARYHTTPSYAKMFSKKNISLEDMEELLANMPDNKRDSFDKEFAKEYLASGIKA